MCHSHEYIALFICMLLHSLQIQLFHLLVSLFMFLRLRPQCSPSASEGEDSAKTKDSNTSESGKRSSIATDEAKSTSKQTETREERLNAPMDEFERKALFFIVRKFLLSHVRLVISNFSSCLLFDALSYCAFADS